MNPYTLRQLFLYFLKLGTVGFGGPVALVGYMHRDLVENRKWIPEEDYKNGLALAQLAPGPLAAQLSIYLGFVHYRVLGSTICGLAFVIPSFMMVVALGILYQQFGGLPWMQAIFYGVGAAVIGIIVMSSYKLTVKSIGKITLPLIKQNWLLWLFYIAGVTVTIITKSEEILLFVGAGLIYMLIKAPPKWKYKQGGLNTVLLGIVGFWQFEWTTLEKIGWFFTKAGELIYFKKLPESYVIFIAALTGLLIKNVL